MMAEYISVWATADANVTFDSWFLWKMFFLKKTTTTRSGWVI